MGHDTGLKESYNKAQSTELLDQYLKAVPDLTIPEVARSPIVSSEDIEPLKKKIAQLEEDRRKDRETLSDVLSILRELRSAKK